MRITIATFEGMPPQFGADDRLLLEKLRERGAEVDYVPWTSPGADWDSPDLVHARSPWDYAVRRAEFVEWIHGVGAALENAPQLIEWNSDKRYLSDLADEGVPVVDTAYIGPGESAPTIDSQVVIKPSVSAGARDTGRFGPDSAAEGRALIERITARGEVAMVQPFLPSVETAGETAVVTIAGRVSHILHKRPVLAADEIAPIREDELRVAEAMYDPGLVSPGSAEPDELELAARIIGIIEERFGGSPLVARVDMLRGGDGAPVLLELEAIEPNLYFEHCQAAADRLADAIIERAAWRAGEAPAGRP